MHPSDGARVVCLNAFFYSFTVPVDTFLTYSVPASACILKTHRAWYIIEPSATPRFDDPPVARLRKRDRCTCLPSYSDMQRLVDPSEQSKRFS